jgi:hypothetical protein
MEEERGPVPDPEDQNDEVLRQMFRERRYPDLRMDSLHLNMDDIPVIKAADKDMREMFARAYMQALTDRITDFGNRIPTVCALSALIMKKAATWRTLAQLLDTDDSIWQTFFARDFEQFGERAHDWTRNRPMPWKSAYLWTVFFRRRCLRSVLQEIPGHPDLRMIPFGLSGCVCAVEEWRIPPYSGPPEVLAGHWVVDGGPGLHMSFYGINPNRTRALDHYLLEGRSIRVEDQRPRQLPPIVSFPGDVLMSQMVRISQREYVADMRKPPRPLRAIFASSLRPQRQLAWSYSDALFAYCSFGRVHHAGEKSPLSEEDRAIFDDLPHYPYARGRDNEEHLYLGTKAQ